MMLKPDLLASKTGYVNLEDYSKELWTDWALTSKSAPGNKAATCKLGLSLAVFSRSGPLRVTDELLVGIA